MMKIENPLILKMSKISVLSYKTFNMVGMIYFAAVGICAMTPKLLFKIL